MSSRLANRVFPYGMRFRDDGSADLSGTAERELFNVKLGQSQEIQHRVEVTATEHSRL